MNGVADNDPMEDRSDHGTHVAGIASAVTNNGRGMSSIGYSCRLMPVKTSRNDVRSPQGVALVSFGYEGIVYAAENGADIINTSWGGAGFSRLGQEVIDYAVSKGSLIISAAGNDNQNTDFFPASYTGVISVGSSDLNDRKSSYSNYGSDIDVMAPGAAIISTWQNDTYIINSGTSMAAPFTAGLAGLIKSVFPNYTPQQIGEQLRATAEDIYSANPALNYLLGRGRIDASKAVTVTDAKSVRAVDVKFFDEAPGGNSDSVFMPGETITIAVTFTNYLSPVSGLTVTLQPMSDYVSIINGTFNAGSVATLETFNNNSALFTFRLDDTLPSNTDISFLLRFNDGSGYSDFQWINIRANPDYVTQTGNEVSLTITSRGNLAFNDYPTNLQGNGFHYRTSRNLIFEGALITGVSDIKISDAARGTTPDIQNRDFNTIKNFTLKTGIPDHSEGETIFNDFTAGGQRIGITVTLRSYIYPDPALSGVVLLRYSIKNDNATVINNIHAGLFLDWDLIEGSGSGDITSWDALANFSYVYNVSGTPAFYCGTALLAPSGYNFYGIRNDGGDGGFGIYDNFTDVEKWRALSSGIGKTSAGPGDISHIVAGGPYSINPGETIEIGFMLGCASTLDSLRMTVSAARNKFYEIIDVTPPVQQYTFQLLPNYPNPFNTSTNISFSIPSNEHVTLKIFNILGEEVRTLVNEQKSAGAYTVNFNAGTLSSGVYIYKLQSGSNLMSRKLILLK